MRLLNKLSIWRNLSVENVSASAACEPESAPAGAFSAQYLTIQALKWRLLRQNCAGIVDYLLDSEVHTFAFSVAANAIISFIPLVVLLYSIAISVFHSGEMVKVVNKL